GTSPRRRPFHRRRPPRLDAVPDGPLDRVGAPRDGGDDHGDPAPAAVAVVRRRGAARARRAQADRRGPLERRHARAHRLVRGSRAARAADRVFFALPATARRADGRVLIPPFMRSLLLVLLLLASSTARAQVTSSDFAFGSELTLDGSGPIYRVPVPPD